MRYFLIITQLLLPIFMMAAATQKGDQPNYVLFETEGKQGLKDESGAVIIPAEYDALGWTKGDFQIVKGVVGFNVNGLWGLLNLENEKITQPFYTQLFVDGKQIIAAKKRLHTARDYLGTITPKGQEVIPFNYADIKIDGLRAIVAKKKGLDYLFGLLDMDGDVIIPLNYKQIKPLGGLRFSVENFQGKTAIFDDKGQQMVDFTLDSISTFRQGYAIIYDKHRRGLMANDGTFVLEPVYHQVKIGSEIEVKSFNKWFMLTGDNTTIAQLEAESLGGFSDYFFKASANEHMWLVNDQGTVETELYNDILPLSGNLAAFKKKDRWGVLNISGKEKLSPRFDSLVIDDDMIRTKRHGYWSLYDSFDIKKTRAQYNYIGKKSGLFFPVNKGRHWGFIDRSGNEVISCVYDEVGVFRNGLVAVSFHGEKGVINKVGEWIVLPHKADSIQVLNRAYYISYLGKLKKLKDFSGDLIYFTENNIEVKDGYLLEHISDGGIWKVDFSGQIIEEARDESYQEVRSPSEGFYAIKKDDSYGFIDHQNRLRIANRYEEVGDFHEGLAAFKLLNKWGFLNKKEEIVIQPTFNEVSQFYQNVAVAFENEGAGLINQYGEKISSFSFDSLSIQPNGRFLVFKDNKVGLLAPTGRLMINAKYDYLEDLGNGFIIVRKSEKYGLVDENGVNTIPILYDKLIYDKKRNIYLSMKKSTSEKVELR